MAKQGKVNRPPRPIIRPRTALRKPLSSRPPRGTSEKLPYSLKSVVDLKLQGWSEREIAAYFGITGAAIHQKLKGLARLLDHETLEAYRDNKVAFLNAAEIELLKLILDKGKQAKATLGNVAYAFTQFHQAGRLEQGQSTANLALHEIVEQIERDERQNLERERRRKTPDAAASAESPATGDP